MSKLKLYLRFTPFDTSTAEGLDRERNRVALLSMLTNAGSKGFSMLLVLAGISWTLPYLGADRFGVWMTILSLASVLSFLDLGVGNALTNHVAKAQVQSRLALQEAYTGGLMVILVLALAVFAALQLMGGFIPWQLVFKSAQSDVLGEAVEALQVFYALFALQLFSNAVVRATAGMQRAHVANGLTILLSVVSLALLFVASRHRAGIPAMLAITLMPVCATGCLLFIGHCLQGVFQWPRMLPALQTQAKSVLSIGGLFFVLQIAVMVGWGADALIISSTVGVGGVAAFAIAQRLFQFVSQPLSILNAPLWPAYANAHAQGNHVYIRQLFRRSFGVTFLGALVGVIAVGVSAPWLTHTLSKSTVELSLLFVVLYATWTLIESTGNAWGVFLNGIGVVRPQVIISGLFAVLALPLKFWLVGIYQVPGLVAGNIAAYLLLIAAPYTWLFLTGRIRY